MGNRRCIGFGHGINLGELKAILIILLFPLFTSAQHLKSLCCPGNYKTIDNGKYTQIWYWSSTDSTIVLPTTAKKYKWKKQILPAALIFVAGGFEGAMDGLQFHYDKPNQFWNPDISWTNKYKNNDVAQGKTFAGKYMVFTTDGWHLMKFGRNLFTAGTIAIKIGEEKKKWYIYIAEGLSFWLVNRVGFNLVYGKF